MPKPGIRGVGKARRKEVLDHDQSERPSFGRRVRSARLPIMSDIARQRTGVITEPDWVISAV
jgi:hypothetical protein